MKTRVSALAVAISSISVLTACGGGGPGNVDTKIVSPVTPAPTVTVTAPATATEGVEFTVAWTSTDATSCAADFDSATAATGSASKTESVDGTAAVTKNYTVICTGNGGSATGSASVVVSPNATAEGAWQGTVGSRELSGVVTDEGDYWLAYTSAADNSVPAGFYAGNGVAATGSFPSQNLREFNFAESGGTQQGALAATYTQSVGYTDANTLAGSFDAVQVGSVYDLTITNNQYFVGANGPLIWSGTGTYNADTNTASYAGNIQLPTYGMSIDFNQVITMDEATGKGTMAAITNCTDGMGGAGCSGFSPMLQGAIRNTLGGDLQIGNPDGQDPTVTQSKTAVAFTPTDGGLYSWTLQVSLAANAPNCGVDEFGDPIPSCLNYTPVPLQVTLHAQSLPSITTAAFTSTYNAAYELTPSLATVAGTDYTATPAYTGIGSTLYTNTTTFSISSDGVIAGAESTSGCSYAGTIAPHAVGNVYDVTELTFTGGSCAYTASGAFTGAATYDAAAKKLTLTATNAAHDEGFMVVVAKP